MQRANAVNNLVINYEAIIRLAVFVGFFVVLAMFEMTTPLVKRKTQRALQWSVNLSLAVINGVCLRFTMPLLAVGVAAYANSNDLGLFNYWNLPPLLALIISLVLMDLLLYGQHVLMHKVPLLWRLHAVHHSEQGLDVTTAVRFHPIEIIISMLIKMLVVLLLGVPVLAVIVFEILLNAMAMFNHSNIKLPAKLDRLLRWFIVTPAVHWIHHSVKHDECNSNFGFNLIIWDKWFLTYKSKPSQDYSIMQQGIPQSLIESMTLWQLLWLPFKK